MRSVIVFFTMFFWAVVSPASMVPEQVSVTPEKSQELGFELVDIGSGLPDVVLVELTFPSELGEDLVARRAQTYLFDALGVEISSTSVDYEYGEGTPRLVMHFNQKYYDAALVIQYSCRRKGARSCARSFMIESVRDYLITN